MFVRKPVQVCLVGAVVLMFSSAVVVFAQTSGTVNVRPSLVGDASAIDRGTQELAVAEIGADISHGNLTGADKNILYDALDHLALSGVSYPVISGGTIINNYPTVRREACGLLGKLGGERAMQILMHVVAQERRATVLAEAVYELGVVGLDPNDNVSRRIADVLMRRTVTDPDDNLAMAGLFAIQKLAAANNGIKEPLVYSALTTVRQGAYVQAVQDKAAQVLAELGTYR